MKIDKYISVFNIGLQNTFVYRWNYFLRALFGLIPLAGTVFLWRAIFKERGGGLHGYDYGSMIYYYLLTLLVSNLVTPTEDEWQIAADIREGQINSLLTKPMSYLAYRFSIFMSGRLVYTFVTLPPIALIFIYFRHYIALPDQAMTYVLASISMVMAALMQFFITYSLAMMAFWILEISTIVFIGPVSPDTVFTRTIEGDFDAVLCMYHDQGLIPLKLHAFHSGVNVTLGLPFPRTSPDHGTAFEIAGKGIARPDSMIAAINLAVEMAACPVERSRDISVN